MNSYYANKFKDPKIDKFQSIFVYHPISVYLVSFQFLYHTIQHTVRVRCGSSGIKAKYCWLVQWQNPFRPTRCCRLSHNEPVRTSGGPTTQCYSRSSSKLCVFTQTTNENLPLLACLLACWRVSSAANIADVNVVGVVLRDILFSLGALHLEPVPRSRHPGGGREWLRPIAN